MTIKTPNALTALIKYPKLPTSQFLKWRSFSDERQNTFKNLRQVHLLHLWEVCCYNMLDSAAYAPYCIAWDVGYNFPLKVTHALLKILSCLHSTCGPLPSIVSKLQPCSKMLQTNCNLFTFNLRVLNCNLSAHSHPFCVWRTRRIKLYVEQ